MEQSERRQHEGSPLYRIPEYNLDNLKARVAKMNRRAAKLGMEPLVISEVDQEFDLYYRRDTMFDEIDMGYRIPWGKVEVREGELITEAQARFNVEKKSPQVFSLRRFVTLTVTGTLPRVNGWAMAATIQHSEGGNLLMTVPGFDTLLPMKYRTATTACEHCGHDRQRKDTYVLQHEDGTWKQVGRNCLADFIRSTNAGAWAEAAEMLAGLDGEMAEYEDDGGEGGGRGTIYFTAESLLSQVANVVRNDGWCSRTEAKNSMMPKTATVDFALCLFDPKFLDRLTEKQRDTYAVSEEDKAKAIKAIDWAQSLPSEVSNDYLWNIRVVSHRENITHREAGLAGSIIAAYLRHLEQEVKRQYERLATLNEYIGEVGKRDILTLTCTAERGLESAYGSLTLYKFRDADGRTAAWFASNQADLEIGSMYRLKASVKKHEMYQGMRQTLLTRATVLANLTALDNCLKGEHGLPVSMLGGPEYCTVCGEVLAEATELVGA